MRPHDCPDVERGDYCALCERAIHAAEEAREFPETDGYGADAAAADMVFGRWDQ